MSDYDDFCATLLSRTTSIRLDLKSGRHEHPCRTKVVLREQDGTLSGIVSPNPSSIPAHPAYLPRAYQSISRFDWFVFI